MTDEELLDLRFRDLDLSVSGTWLEDMVQALYEELEEHDLRCRPHCWLSSEWFVFDGVPGIAIPFYLAHPRLMKLEKRQMLEVEGGTKKSCMRILRHEAGHAIDVAYRLRRRKAWREVFGPAARPYPTHYRPEPFSRDFVLHLDWWYAQAHPVEDFAETFAVWLKPGREWRRHYADWPALRKLRFVEQLMHDLAGEAPPVRSRKRIDPLPRLDRTLRQHYREKRRRYDVEVADGDAYNLSLIFGREGREPTALAFFRRRGRALRELVAHWTGQPLYTVDQFLQDMVKTCRGSGLRLRMSEQETMLEVAVLLTVEVMEYLRGGGRRVAL